MTSEELSVLKWICFPPIFGFLNETDPVFTKVSVINSVGGMDYTAIYAQPIFWSSHLHTHIGWLTSSSDIQQIPLIIFWLIVSWECEGFFFPLFSLLITSPRIIDPLISFTKLTCRDLIHFYGYPNFRILLVHSIKSDHLRDKSILNEWTKRWSEIVIWCSKKYILVSVLFNLHVV